MIRLDLEVLEHPPTKLPSHIYLASRLMDELAKNPDLFPSVIVVPPDTGHGENAHPEGAYGCKAPAGACCAANWLVGFVGEHGGLQSYKVSEYDMCRDGWLAAWPD